jgi:hypothetical protein
MPPPSSGVSAEAANTDGSKTKDLYNNMIIIAMTPQISKLNKVSILFFNFKISVSCLGDRRIKC